MISVCVEEERVTKHFTNEKKKRMRITACPFVIAFSETLR